MSDVALAAFRQGEMQQAINAYRAAAQMDPRSVFCSANLAIVLARQEQCRDATQALREAQRRLAHRPGPETQRIVSQAMRAVDGCNRRARATTPRPGWQQSP
jgi:predicted Zn-dependent protease